MTIAEALEYGTEKVGRRDAGLLLSHITSKDLHLESFTFLEGNQREKFLAFTGRLLAKEPLQYVIGQWDFMGLSFLTDKRALIPRPETELLVEEALKFILKTNATRILDICTGSGCIALSLAHFTNAEFTAVDISDDALSLARENAEKLKIPPERVKFVKSDLLGNISEKFDVIISNPPYVLSGEIPTLSENVRCHEPHLALDGGTDGLDIYRRLIPQAKDALLHCGALFLEIGPPEVADLMTEAGFTSVTTKRDYAGIKRIISGYTH
ncbi:MAG: peptide chain release factor N(5)-glutamine methyltransferase [Defluviitaleaceae bacterium]|nr:peptide chain release factor N(5)-glutamine methyltransferase [Defluviitaleaceae bacterium]